MCPGRQGCGSTPFPSCSVLGACCGHTGQGSRSGADHGHLRALPIPAPRWRPLASPTARSDPAARGRPPCPHPGLGPHDSLSLLSPPAGWGARAGQTWSCLFSARLKVTRGVLGVLGCPRESVSPDAWGPGSPLPTQPGDGRLLPHKQPAEAAGTFFLPLDPTLCPQSPSLCRRPRKASRTESSRL